MKSQHIVSKTVNILGTYEITLASYIHSCSFVFYIIKKVLFVNVSFYLLGNFKDCSYTDLFSLHLFWVKMITSIFD